MKKLHTIPLFLALALTANADTFHDALGPQFKSSSAPIALPTAHSTSTDVVHRWNEIAINATGLDHTPVAPGENRTFGEQLGPGRSSRAMAIVHIAIFEAVNAIAPKYQSYASVQAPRGALSMDVAVGQAARDTLVALFPSQTSTFDNALAAELSRVHSKKARNNGVLLGHRAANAILALRASDGSEVPEPRMGVDYFPNNVPGEWQQDPISLIPLALGAHWGECRTFVLQSSAQFRVPAPPAMTSSAYTDAYTEAKNLGGDGITTPTQRTPEQTFVSTFWAYDGTPSLCAPPRLYNQIAVQLADQEHVNTVGLARLLALINTAMADAGFSAWESKYFYKFWRPITAIRQGGTDGNDDTTADSAFSPLGAPASNLTGPNFTPPFPAYPSGHATFGGALFQTLRRFFGTDNVSFTFVSDEFNGVTRDHNGNVRPFIPRTFASLSQAAEENGQSRIYLGIHWAFDKTAGIAQGEQVANYVFDHAFTKLH